MSKSANPHKLTRWPIEEIVVSDRLRAGIREDIVIALTASIVEIGLREPPTIRIERDADGGEYPVLVTGMHRVEACKRLNLRSIDCVEFQGSTLDAKLWEISENLHRAELTVQERSEHIAAWIRLTEEKGVSAQLAPKLSTKGRISEGRAPSGINAATRELGMAPSSCWVPADERHSGPSGER